MYALCIMNGQATLHPHWHSPASAPASAPLGNKKEKCDCEISQCSSFENSTLWSGRSGGPCGSPCTLFPLQLKVPSICAKNKNKNSTLQESKSLPICKAWEVGKKCTVVGESSQLLHNYAELLSFGNWERFFWDFLLLWVSLSPSGT
jgi:hypothetical protein